MLVANRFFRVALGAAFCFALFGSAASAAEKYYMKVEGTKQGEFKGSVTRNGSRWIEVSSFNYTVQSPRDAATGQASGKRQHKPIVIQKNTDSASPQLFQACTTNEVLKEVVFQVTRTGPAGKERLYQTFTLTNAHIPSAKKVGGKGTKKKDEEEEIEFTFQKIVTTNASGKVTATDDWTLTK